MNEGCKHQYSPLPCKRNIFGVMMLRFFIVGLRGLYRICFLEILFNFRFAILCDCLGPGEHRISLIILLNNLCLV